MPFWKSFNKQYETDQGNVEQVQIERSIVEVGLLFHIAMDSSKEAVSFPLQLPIHELRQQQQLELLEIVEGLWLDEWIQETESGYFLLPYEKLIQLSSEVLNLMNVPDHTTVLQLRLSHEGAVGLSNFRFVLEKNLGQWKHLERTSNLIGPWLTMPDRSLVLMDEEQYRLQVLLNQQPNPRDKERIFAYVAEVRSLTKQMGIPMDEYLEKQEYLFVDGIDIKLSHKGDKITLNPVYKTNDPIPEDFLSKMGERTLPYAQINKGQKVFVSPTVQQKAQKIAQVEPIEGSNIPRFIENPEAFIPEIEGLDLSLFGERVKSLGIQVYRAQPYVHAREKERGWFDIDFGFHPMDETGESQGKIEHDEIKKLIHQAQQVGDDFIKWNDNWLKIPQDADSFVQATEQLKGNPDLKNQFDITKLPLILKIFENIDRLEFNQPIVNAQQEMKDLGILSQEPPSSFTATLKSFQVDGFIWMKSLHYHRLGGLLADDMGLGKTIQVISFLAYLNERKLLGPTLIVVPKTLIDNWQKEIRKFAPLIYPFIYVHSGNNRIKSPDEIRKFGITLTTYQILVRDQLVLGQVDWMTMFCDEAQAIKNPSTSVSRVVKAMKTKFRLALTGTPVENSLSELWSIMDYVQPGLLGSLSQFRKEFIAKLEDVNEPSDEIEQQLFKKISIVYKRRTKSGELGDQLPPKYIESREIPLGAIQMKLYEEIIQLVQNKMMGGLQAIQRLKQLCSHPGLVNENYINLPIDQIPKLHETIHIIQKVKQIDEKVLIFTEYVEMQDLLKQTIRQQFNINPRVINGMTSRRQEVVDYFNAKIGFDVMILSPKAAGTGLTITSANHVIHYTRWWNPAVENQATDRVYRIGQTKPVTVYYPIVIDKEKKLQNGTVEQIVHQILNDKQDLASSIIIPSRRINMEEEILKAFRF